MRKIGQRSCAVMAAFIFMVGTGVWAEEAGLADDVLETQISLDQMVKDKDPGSPPEQVKSFSSPAGTLTEEEQREKLINESLKNAVEENKKLTQQNKAMEDELKSLRGSSELNVNRINLLNSQREALQRRVEQIENQNRLYKEQMDRLQATMAGKEKELNAKVSDMEKQIADKKAEEERAMQEVLPRLKSKEGLVSDKELANAKQEAQDNLKKLETHTQQVTAQVARIALENKKIKIDSAKLHYNLANTFFERGDYQRAAAEYKQVVELLPMDADAHYNLAFVYGEFLNRPGEALEHYRMYLHLNPYAGDAALVKEKILEAELSLKTAIPSPAEEMLQRESRKEGKNVMVTTGQ